MKTILLIDDNELVLKSLARALRHHGFAVHAITTPLAAEDALVMLKPDAILTDYKMPWMNGAQVLDIARRVAPDALRCLMSGNLDDVKPEELQRLGEVKVFPKPLPLDTLFAALDAAPELEAGYLEAAC